ncbi:MAG: DUF3048 domain-containing protein [Eubacterium sp.]|nr:DUF3048 domain-containing protein [Eubacterium sp.]
MSDKELDEILNQIRNHSENEGSSTDSLINGFDKNRGDEVDKNFDILEEPAPAIHETADSVNTDILGINEKPLVSEFDRPRDNFEDEPGGKKPNDKKKKIIILAVSAIVTIAIIVGVFFGILNKKDDKTEPEKTTVEATEVISEDEELGPINPLTGETGYSKAALSQRPVAVVVENEYSTESVRPQWGINEADILLEGESEFSTRLLLFWADYNSVPKQVGPARSARPPYIRFSQLFDCVFIHAGLSHTKGNYTGADTVFESENIDHINLLKYGEDGKYFGRDTSKTSTIEHTGYLNGENVEELIKNAGIETKLDINKFTALEFNKKAKALSETKANKISFIWSDIYSSGKCPKTGKFYYVEESKKYTTNDFDSEYGTADLEFENLIFLLDETEYIVKENYKNGQSETYCDYKLTGGSGKIMSQGTSIDINWSVEGGKLVIKDKDGKAVKLNPGKSYIGYGSENHGGKVTIEE